MIQVTLKDGSVKEVQSSTTCLELARQLSNKLAKNALAAEIDGEVKDLTTPITKDCTVAILTFADAGGRNALRHTASHILAQAVKQLYPDVRLAIGPAIEDGYYYDFDAEKPFTTEEMAAVEKEMEKIIQQNLPLERFELPREEAIRFMEEKEEPYKVQLIRDLPEDAVISFYRQGDFTDLCAGPHLPSTGMVKCVKLLSCTGAYWRGDSKNKMLQRIYGTAFPKQSELQAHLTRLEEAKQRDHNLLGRKLGYFTTSDLIGQGLPVMLPKGARVMQLLQRFVEDEEQRRGWLLTKTPYMAKSDLYKLSGHWGHYKEGMFVLGDEEKDEEVFALRPMT